MARLEENGAGKAPRCKNAGNSTASAYQRTQSAKGRAKQRPGMAALRDDTEVHKKVDDYSEGTFPASGKRIY
jgi:hypothetical protein